MRVAVCREHFEDTFAQLQNRDIERSATEVIHGDGPLPALLQPVGERSGSGFVDDAEDVESRNPSRILCRLSLRVVEVRRHRDNRARDLFAKSCFGISLQLAENKGRYLRGGVFAAEDFQTHDAVAGWRHLEGQQGQVVAHVGEPLAHESLDGEDGVARLLHHFLARRVADEHIAALVEVHHRRHQIVSIGSRNHSGHPVFHDGDKTVCSSKVYTDDTGHYDFSSNSRSRFRMYEDSDRISVSLDNCCFRCSSEALEATSLSQSFAASCNWWSKPSALCSISRRREATCSALALPAFTSSTCSLISKISMRNDLGTLLPSGLKPSISSRCSARLTGCRSVR